MAPVFRTAVEPAAGRLSGGEQQRVNIARGSMGEHSLLLLDEPTVSLDAMNLRVVLEMINKKKAVGVGMLGIFHDPEARAAVADRIIDVSRFALARSDRHKVPNPTRALNCMTGRDSRFYLEGLGSWQMSFG